MSSSPSKQAKFDIGDDKRVKVISEEANNVEDSLKEKALVQHLAQNREDGIGSDTLRNNCIALSEKDLLSNNVHSMENNAVCSGQENEQLNEQVTLLSDNLSQLGCLVKGCLNDLVEKVEVLATGKSLKSYTLGNVSLRV